MTKPTVSEFFAALKQAELDNVDLENQDELIAHCNEPVSTMLESIDSFTYYRLINNYQYATE
jgi:hypothetical protein